MSTLPIEIINKILYEFNGCQTPSAALLKGAHSHYVATGMAAVPWVSRATTPLAFSPERLAFSLEPQLHMIGNVLLLAI